MPSLKVPLTADFACLCLSVPVRYRTSQRGTNAAARSDGPSDGATKKQFRPAMRPPKLFTGRNTKSTGIISAPNDESTGTTRASDVYILRIRLRTVRSNISTPFPRTHCRRALNTDRRHLSTRSDLPIRYTQHPDHPGPLTPSTLPARDQAHIPQHGRHPSLRNPLARGLTSVTPPFPKARVQGTARQTLLLTRSIFLLNRFESCSRKRAANTTAPTIPGSRQAGGDQI